MKARFFEKSEDGQGLVEYALVLVGVAVVTVLILSLTGVRLQTLYCKAISGLGGAGCGCNYSFDNPEDLAGWDPVGKGDQFSIQNGKGCISGGDKILNSCSEDFGPNNFLISLAGVTLDEVGGGNTGFDVEFRTQDKDNGYKFIYNESTNVVRFWKIVKGKWIMLESVKTPDEWSGEDLNFEVKVDGDTFTAYKDGEQILQATDSTYSQGKFGLRSKPGAVTCVDDFSVQP